MLLSLVMTTRLPSAGTQRQRTRHLRKKRTRREGAPTLLLCVHHSVLHHSNLAACRPTTTHTERNDRSHLLRISLQETRPPAQSPFTFLGNDQRAAAAPPLDCAGERPCPMDGLRRPASTCSSRCFKTPNPSRHARPARPIGPAKPLHVSRARTVMTERAHIGRTRRPFAAPGGPGAAPELRAGRYGGGLPDRTALRSRYGRLLRRWVMNYELSGLVRQHADVRPKVWENDRKLIVLIVLAAVTQDGEAPVVLIVHLVRRVRMHAGEVAYIAP